MNPAFLNYMYHVNYKLMTYFLAWLFRLIKLHFLSHLTLMGEHFVTKDRNEGREDREAVHSLGDAVL